MTTPAATYTVAEEMIQQLQVIKTDLEAKFQDLKARVQNLIADIKKNAPNYRASLENKAITVMRSDLFKGITRALHVVRVAITILTLGFISPTRLPVLFAKIVKGTAIIYKATRLQPQQPVAGAPTQPEQTPKEAFAQAGSDPKKGIRALKELLKKAMTPKQQGIAAGTAIIAGAVLEATIFPIAMVTASVDAILLSKQIYKMPSLSEVADRVLPQSMRNVIPV